MNSEPALNNQKHTILEPFGPQGLDYFLHLSNHFFCHRSIGRKRSWFSALNVTCAILKGFKPLIYLFRFAEK